jgi:hypothetical protein
MIANVLRLNEAEVDALRGLQAGVNHLDAHDPVWDELIDLHLAKRGGVHAGVVSLTMGGRRYKID